jgi:hypothetical protein
MSVAHWRDCSPRALAITAALGPSIANAMLAIGVPE